MSVQPMMGGKDGIAFLGGDMGLYHRFLASDLAADFGKLILTFLIAFAAGWFLLKVRAPAPFLMGSLFGVWVFGGLVRPLRRHLGVAKWVYVPVILGLGVMIGENFKAGILEQASHWSLTVTAMILTTLLVSLLGYLFLNRRCGYEPRLALLCSIPGGQAEALAIARDTVEKDYVVAPFHLVRVVIVFISTPLLLALIRGQEAVIASNISLQQMPSLFSVDLASLLIFFALGLSGYLLARLCRLPMPHLLGPMGLSMLGHGAGWIELPRIHEFIVLAQIVIGAGVGARLARVPFAEVFSYLKTASASALLILGGYVAAAFGIAHLSGTSFLAMWMAFVPGGFYEVTLLALVFGFDVAFVAFHHTVRVLIILLSLPSIVFRLRQK